MGDFQIIGLSLMLGIFNDMKIGEIEMLWVLKKIHWLLNCYTHIHAHMYHYILQSINTLIHTVYTLVSDSS